MNLVPHSILHGQCRQHIEQNTQRVQSIHDGIVEHIVNGPALSKIDGWVVSLVLVEDGVYFLGQGGAQLVVQELDH